MRKLKLAIEELAVESFDAGAARGREGTVAARAADTTANPSKYTQCEYCGTYTICEVADNTCFQPSRNPNEAACAPPPEEVFAETERGC